MIGDFEKLKKAELKYTHNKIEKRCIYEAFKGNKKANITSPDKKECNNLRDLYNNIYKNYDPNLHIRYSEGEWNDRNSSEPPQFYCSIDVDWSNI